MEIAFPVRAGRAAGCAAHRRAAGGANEIDAFRLNMGLIASRNVCYHRLGARTGPGHKHEVIEHRVSIGEDLFAKRRVGPPWSVFLTFWSDDPRSVASGKRRY